MFVLRNVLSHYKTFLHTKNRGISISISEIKAYMTANLLKLNSSCWWPLHHCTAKQVISYCIGSQSFLLASYFWNDGVEFFLGMFRGWPALPWQSTGRPTQSSRMWMAALSLHPSGVHNLGVMMDPTITFQVHIKNITKSTFFHFRNISRLLPTFSTSVTETLVHSFITRLNYCNGVLSGLPYKVLDSMHRIQRPGNAHAQSLSITSLQLLFSFLLLTYKSLHVLAPQ